MTKVAQSGFTMVPEDVPATVRVSVYADQIDAFLATGEPSVKLGIPADMKLATVVQGLRKASEGKGVKVRQKQTKTGDASVYLQIVQGE